ncbi:MAG TPA: two-component regulator propeller domain-containing protein [Candidatus Sulfotelmatobacter sp.]|nr:two-component regulator propeller domain-containing protein [Candidatus Sulfotelmatobacter sp.]
MALSFVFLVLPLSSIFAASGRSTLSPLDAYAERMWQMQDGLPEQIVQAFAQTADRYLWIGTTGGLLRFDGERFVLYNRENTPAFRDNNIFCLTVSRDNTLWIGTEGGGLIQYRHGKFRAFSNSEGLTNAFVRDVAQDATGQIWIGTDEGLFRLAGERVERFDGRGAIPALAVHAIHEDREGRLWVGGSKLLQIAGAAVTEYSLEGAASENRVKSVEETADGTIWVGTVSGLQRMTPDTQSNRAFKKVHEVDGTVRFLRETSDGRLWIGTIGHGLNIYGDHHFSQITAPRRLPSNTVLNLFEDVEKNIWVGTQAGMLRFSKTPVRTVTLPDASDSDAETVYQDRDGDLWIAAANLFRFQSGTATPYAFPGLSGVRIRNVFRDREGALWIGTEGRGVFRQIGGRMVQYTTQEGLVNNFIRAFLQSRDGSVWIATDEGVSRWRQQGFTNYEMRDGLCYFSTRSLLEDQAGDIWIGTDRGVSRLHGDKFENDNTIAALKEEKVWAIHQDSDGGLWFGTRTAGLYRRHAGKLEHYTVAQGLASNSIYELLEDKNGNFWISGPNGISVINRRELETVAEHPGRSAAVTLYGISEGLETIQMCGGEKPAGVLTTQGEIWFPSSKGPVRVSVEQPKASNPAPVVIDQVMVDGLQVRAPGKVSLTPNTAKLELHYGVVLLRSQERMRFRYTLEGFDKNWSEASADRVAHYTNLPPGQYHFRVAAFEMDNPEQITEASLEMIQEPHFYRTFWFLTFCLFLLAAMVWSVYQFRLGQLRVRFQAVLHERNRLAREMHDTLIQGCVSVSALLEAHSSLGEAEGDARNNLLDYARTQLRSTIDEAREAVFNLRVASESSTSLGPLLRRMTEQVSHEFGVPVACNISGNPFEFEQSTVHELLMVAREAIYNAVRHGQPSKVELGVRFEEDECSVKVQDDGSGFDPEMVSSLPEGHYGLIGIKERVSRMGGQLMLNSRCGAGTELVIHIPRNPITASEQVPEANL